MLRRVTVRSSLSSDGSSCRGPGTGSATPTLDFLFFVPNCWAYATSALRLRSLSTSTSWSGVAFCGSAVTELSSRMDCAPAFFDFPPILCKFHNDMLFLKPFGFFASCTSASGLSEWWFDLKAEPILARRCLKVPGVTAVGFISSWSVDRRRGEALGVDWSSESSPEMVDIEPCSSQVEDTPVERAVMLPSAKREFWTASPRRRLGCG